MNSEYAQVFKEARDAVTKKGYAGARDLIIKQCEAYPDCEELHALKALVLIWTGDLEGAESIINKRLALKPSASINGIKGELEMFLARSDDAEDSIAKAEELDPTDYFYLRSAIGCTTLAGDLEGSLDLVNKSLKIYPEDAETYASGITAYQSADRYEDAESLLESAPDWFKETADYHSKRGMFLLRKQSFADAEQELQQAVALCPDGSMYWAYLGMTQGHLGKETEAERSSNFAIEANPRNTIALRTLSRLAQRRGDQKASQEFERRAVASIPAMKEMGLSTQANNLLRQGKQAEAIELYRKLAQKGHRTSAHMARKMIVSLLINTERWKEAREALDELLKTHSEVPAIRIYRVQVTYHEGQVEQALAELDDLIDQPEPPADIYQVAVKLYAKEGREERLRKVIATVMERLPGSASTLGGVIMELDNAGLKDEARELFVLTNRRYPNNQILKVLEFGLAVSRGDKSEAMQMLRNLPPEMRVRPRLSKLILNPRFWRGLFSTLFRRKK
jgi:tetratricopeptide (TPR) repeat protein